MEDELREDFVGGKIPGSKGVMHGVRLCLQEERKNHPAGLSVSCHPGARGLATLCLISMVSGGTSRRRRRRAGVVRQGGR